MENNYYKLKNKKSKKINKRVPAKHTSASSSTAKTSQNAHTSRSRGKSARRRIDYKKVFIFFVFLALLFYLICFGISKIPAVVKPQEASAPAVEEPKDITINMAVIGDIMCHSSNYQAAYDAENNTYDFSYVFTDIKDYIQTADIAIGNLETTFAGSEVGYSGYPTFNTPEQLAQNLVDLGVDVVSTANNHSLDKRYNGLVSTLDELDKVNLAHTGTYRSKEEQDTITTKNVNGINIAFLSFTYGTNGIPVPSGKEYCINLIDEDLILDQISKAKALNPDLICVNMHWGEEYKLKQNKNQEKLADFLFKNGVDIILGSHPHVLEPMERRTITLEDGTVKDGFLIYSLGNFVSGQVIENTMNTIILQLQITKHPDNTISIDSVKYVPIFLSDKGVGQPNRFKLLDINKTLEDYENGNSDISAALYNRLKDAKNKIESIVDIGDEADNSAVNANRNK
jgi:poly-gamma-glutamate synthesis protein (capsule biosynthesis protein)